MTEQTHEEIEEQLADRIAHIKRLLRWGVPPVVVLDRACGTDLGDFPKASRIVAQNKLMWLAWDKLADEESYKADKEYACRIERHNLYRLLEERKADPSHTSGIADPSDPNTAFGKAIRKVMDVQSNV